MKQLERRLKGYTYYCIMITDSRKKADDMKVFLKESGDLARVFKLKKNRNPIWGVFRAYKLH